MRPWIALAALNLGGCFVYEPGTLGPNTTRLDCLETGVGWAWPKEAEGPVAVIKLGNRCDHSIAVDLTKLRVVGGDDTGSQVAMIPYDPRHEIEPCRIYARNYGEEWIEVHPEHPAGQLDWLDVDVGGLEPGTPIGARWIRIRIGTKESP